MLRRTPSLALRAGLIFISIYTIIFVSVLTIAAIADAAEPDANRHDGARVALSLAVDELQPVGRTFALPSDGSFAQLAAKNPSLWLIGRSGGRAFAFGPVPETARRLLDQHWNVLESGGFRVPNARPPLSVAAIRRYNLGRESLLLAAGGVDPASLTPRDSLRQFGPPVLLVLTVIAILGFLAMLIALPLFSRAISPITDEAGALRPEAPDRRLDDRKAPRELLPLVRAFNATLDRLAAELARRKRFITDVAHELRTPLAVVSLRVEALEEESAKRDLRRGVGRLTHLVAQMLDLERLSLSAGERSPVDLSAVARDVVADLAPTAIKAGYDLSLDAPDAPVIVAADGQAISRAITNLIGNSIAHGGGAGHIMVVVRADRTIDVLDEGPGVPAALQPRLFQPFSRGSQDGEGCGLGLHLTREIVRAHGGEVSLLPDQSGATFRLSFASPDG